jgi:hypothetical protein
MSSTLTPSMGLIVPVVGSEQGPQYAADINNDLQLLDQHNHTNGSGVQITPAAININSALTFNGNFATNLAGLTLTAQGSTPANNTIYESGVDLYYVDGLGHNIRITQSGGIAGTNGSIGGLTSPASATYASLNSTFVWQSTATLAANMDFGSATFRNQSPNSTYGLTLQPPTLTSNYTITLPVLPSTQSVLTLDGFGNMATPVAYPIASSGIASGAILSSNINGSANILGTQLSPSANILGTQLSPSANILGTQLSPTAGITPGQNDSTSYSGSSVVSSFSTGNTSPTLVTSVTLSNITTTRPLLVSFYGGSISLSASSGTGTTTATVQIYQVNTVTTVKTLRASYPLPTLTGSNSVLFPSSAFTTILPPSAINSNLEVAMYVFVTNTVGVTGTIGVNNATMAVMQV